MAKFVISKREKDVISVRLDSDMLTVLDKKAAENGISRNELINQMIAFSLENMEEKN